MANKKKYSEEEQKLFKLYSKATGKQAVWKNKITNGFKAWKKEQEVVDKVEETEDMEEAMEAVKAEEETDEFDELLDDLDDEIEVEEEAESETEKRDVEEDELEIEELSEEEETDEDELWIFHDEKYWLPTKKFAVIAGVVVQAINSRYRNMIGDLEDHSMLLKVNGNRKQRFFDTYAVETISEKLKVNVWELISNKIPK